MKIVISKDLLLKPLNIVTNFTADANALKKNQIFNNLLIQLTEESLRFVATDSITDLITSIPRSQLTSVDDANNSGITLNAKQLKSICSSEIVRKTKSDESELITLDYDDQTGQLLVLRGRAKYKLATMDADRFPQIPPTVVNKSFTMKEGDFRDLIRTTKFSMGVDDVRTVFNGILVDVRHKVVNVIASDSHRLAYNSFNLDEIEDDFECSINMSRKSVQELYSILQNTSNDIKINVSEKTFSVVTDNFTYSSKMLEGAWPNYLKLFPDPSTITATFSIGKDTLKNLISGISVLNNDTENWVVVAIDKGNITLRNSNKNHESAEVTSQEVNYDGDYREMSLNHKYITEILNIIASNELKIGIAKNMIQIDLGEEDNQNGILKFIVMLVKL